MMSPAPARLISVVIPHLNQPDFLARCLAALRAGTRQPDEIIVVDNGSAALPEAVCAAYGARFLVEPEPGPGPARNQGIAASAGEVLAFIDADCLADTGWLAAAEAALADPAATILGGDVRIALADPGRMTTIEAYESVYAYRMDRYIARQGFTGTGNLVVRRAVMHDVGPFAGIGVAEDRDWGRRATARGHGIRFVPDMRVLHPARTSFRDLAQKWDRQIAHDWADSKNSRSCFALKTLAMPLSWLTELPQIITTDRLPDMRARGLALACLVRMRLYRTGVMLRVLGGADATALAGRWNRS